MSDAVKLPIQYDGVEGLFAKMDQLGQKIDATADATKSLREAFKLDIALDQIGRVSERFDGFTKEVLKGVEQIGKGFLAGGPIGAGIAAVAVGVEHLAGQWAAEKKAAEDAQKARAETLAKEQAALDATISKMREAVELTATINRLRAQGGKLEEADAAERARRTDEAVIRATEDRDRILGQVREAEARLARQDAILKPFDRANLAATEDRARRDQLARELDDLRAQAEQAKEAVRRAGVEQNAVREQLRAEDTKARAASDEAAEAAAATRAASEAARRRDAAERERQEDIRRALDTNARWVEAERKAQEEAEAEAERQRKDAQQAEIDDAIRVAQTKARILAEAEKKQQAATEKAEQERTRVEAEASRQRIAAAKNEELARQQLIQQAIDGTIQLGENLARSAIEFALSEEEKTKAQYEEAAKRAAIEAAMNAALALANYAQGRYDQAVSAGLAAAEYAAIAVGNGIASTGATNTPASTGTTATASGGASFSRSTDSGNSGGSQAPITIVMGSGGVLVTSADVQRSVQKALAEAGRTR